MNATSPARSKHEPRVEDDALVRGNGRFVDDPRLPDQAYAAFVRSPHAHARVVSVNADEARKAKGVLTVHVPKTAHEQPHQVEITKA